MRRGASEPSLTQVAYERLRADILACRLTPGTKLKINELCEQLPAGLGAVREALSRLTSEGLVVAEPQRGFGVAPISQAELEDLTGVRAELEGLCLRRAALAGDLAWESRLVAAFHHLSRLPERDPDDPARLSDAWSEAHAAFHAALVSACDSPWLLRLRDILYAQSERYRRLSVPLAQVPRDLVREHREIMQVMLERDGDRAAALMAAHLQATTRILVGSGSMPPAPPVEARAFVAAEREAALAR